VDLVECVHREPASAGQPSLVAGAVEQRQEREPVTGSAVAEAGVPGDRTGAPDELAAGFKNA
jgi:hypothetical protein